MVIPTEPIWVDDKATLDSLCASWMQQARIAIDTEFMRSSTYYPHAGLIQVGDGKGCYLIDPLAIDDLSSLAVLMTHPATVKVIHSCSEDLEVFRFLLGVVPSPLMDTQIAAAYANMGFSLGYAALINDQLGIALDKGETRSDWMQRPLSQSQLHYAALDVAYLLIVYGKILVALKALGLNGCVKNVPYWSMRPIAKMIIPRLIRKSNWLGNYFRINWWCLSRFVFGAKLRRDSRMCRATD